MLVYLSGNSLLTHTPYSDLILAIYSTFLFFYTINSIRPLIAHKEKMIIILFTIIFIIQVILGGSFNIITLGGFYLRFLVAFLTIRLVEDYLSKLVVVMFYLAIISFAFYALQYFIPSVAHIITEQFRPLNQNLGIYGEVNFLIHQYDFRNNVGYRKFAGLIIARNGGPFYEPGPFSAWLLLSMIALGLRHDRFPSKHFFWIINTLSLCVITTISTMGIGLLPLVYFFCMIKQNKHKLSRRIVCVIILTALTYLLVWSGSIQEKLIQEYNFTTQKNLGWEGTRYGGLLYLIPQISQRPFFGWGLHNDYRIRTINITHASYGNGIGFIFIRYGLAGFILMSVCFFGSLKKKR